MWSLKRSLLWAISLATSLSIFSLLALVPLYVALEVLADGRNYHKYAIADLAAVDPANWHGKWLSHIEVEGWVTYLARESDLDEHLRVCDSSDAPAKMDKAHCLVAEIMPTLKPKGYFKPAKGMHVLLRGTYRYDAENPGHHWAECNPVEEMELLH